MKDAYEVLGVSRTATDEEIDQYTLYSSEIQLHTDTVANCQIDII